MKVEQRIGRIDRIGQKNSEVLVWNYVYDDTVEEDIYERLGERINLFEQAVGPLRPILEGLEGEVGDVAMGDSTKSSEELASEAEAESAVAEQKSEQIGLSQDLDEITPEQIIEKSKLDGWTKTYPDLGRIGYEDRPFEPLLTPDVVRRLFTQSQVLRNKGWTFEMLDRELTEEEDAPYKKLYRLNIPSEADPPIPDDPPEDTIQALYADRGEVLVSFDPSVLDWFPSVLIPLPQQELFEYLVQELMAELDSIVDDDIIRIVGDADGSIRDVSPESPSTEDTLIATYGTSGARRLTLDVPLPKEAEARRTVQDWLDRYESTDT
jgi:hypothetical protein